MTVATVAGINVAFLVVFSVFLVATAILLFLTIKFIVAKAKSDKRAFENARADADERESQPT